MSFLSCKQERRLTCSSTRLIINDIPKKLSKSLFFRGFDFVFDAGADVDFFAFFAFFFGQFLLHKLREVKFLHEPKVFEDDAGRILAVFADDEAVVQDYGKKEYLHIILSGQVNEPCQPNDKNNQQA